MRRCHWCGSRLPWKHAITCTVPPDPKEQRVWKTPAPGATDISVDYWKLLGRRGDPHRGDPHNDVLDLHNKAVSQLRIAGGVPIARFDQLSPCSGAEDD